MNVFFLELKAHQKGLFFWSLAMIFLVFSGIAKFYGYSTDGYSQMSNILGLFPKSLQVLFGLNGIDLSRPSGAYGILFMYVVFAAVIHAVLLGTDLIYKEERDKTAEFLFVKPIGRVHVITEKLIAGLLNIAVINVVTLLSSLYATAYFSKQTGGTSDLLVLDIALILLQLLFFFVGVSFAAALARPKAAAGLATGFLLSTFMLYFAINLSGTIDGLSLFTPFKYFEASTILQTGHIDTFYCYFSLSIITLLILITYTRYTKRDLEI